MWLRVRTLLILSLIVIVLGTLGCLADSDTSADTSNSTQNNAKSLSDLGFAPCGWMGDTDNIVFDDTFQSMDSRSDETESIIRIEYKPNSTDKDKWAGIYWLLPECNWGDDPGIDITNFSTLSFKVKGDKGGEKMEFKVGGIEGKYFDSISPAKTTDLLILTNEWKKYSIDLKNNDLSHVLGGFCWVTKSQDNQNGCILYLKEIVYE